MPTSNPDYQCIRCHYHTNHKFDMYRHLYHKKKVCPSTKNAIELTDEIKQHILDNRIYHIPKKSKQQIINQTINNYNTMNNFVTSLDAVTKLEKAMKYNNASLINFDKSIEDRYDNVRYRLDDNVPDHYELRQERLFDIVKEVTNISSNNLEDFNILYDNKHNKLMMYEENQWKELILSSGLNTIVSVIKDFYWDAYERYLIRKINNANTRAFDSAHSRDLLIEYYTFLGRLNIAPYVRDKTDGDILLNDDERTDLCNEYDALYRKQNNVITQKEKETWRMKLKALLETVKSNCKNNVSELNKLVLNMISVDDDFKQELLAITRGR